VSVLSEATCTALPGLAVQLARAYFRMRYPLAYRHLQHYLDGSGAPFPEDVTALFGRNPRAAARVAELIRGRGRDPVGKLIGTTTSTAVIRQGDYDDDDWKLSIGNVDRIDYEVQERDDAGTALVQLWIHDPYQWHPAEDRPSRCMHQAMESQKEDGAKDFMAEGAGHVRLPLGP
jgi:hypothetical protein